MSRAGDHAAMVVDLRRRGISNAAVLSAFASIPRHEFVEATDVDRAYGDHPLPIACGQTISQPFVVAYMAQALQLTPDSRLLEVGTGSGYLTALLCTMVRQVSSIEVHDRLAELARGRLFNLGIENAEIRVGDGTTGWPDQDVRFDAVIGSAAAREVPPALRDCLADDGRLIMPVGGDFQELVLERRHGEQWTVHRMLPVRFVPLISSG
ncbi:MAG: protein-L-isoaspartate(D-aspartate) O-methyltransferase [Candidatus Latescibacterota bacterium]|nr:protein-L-isoaspartate(D-aspartate) O-methyltransferase [Candidatus Latescibacterota bacterium]